MNEKLVEYINSNIFPQYNKNDKAHDINHINKVIKRSSELSNNLNLDMNIIYTAAAYHDIGHHIDALSHEKVSAEIFMKDKIIKDFFKQEDIITIKESIEDHRASSKTEPRSIYGKLLSSADRSIDINESLKRTYLYGLEHYPNYTVEQQTNRAYKHINEKFGNDGYAKIYIKDELYINFLKETEELLNNENKFKERFELINKIK